MKDRAGIRHMVSAIWNSLRGIRDAFKTGCAFRQEVVLGIVHYVLIFIINESFETKLLLASLWIVLMAAELINSAVESVVDFVSPEWNELARYAKDFCSAAVFLLAVLIIIVWLVMAGRAFL